MSTRSRATLAALTAVVLLGATAPGLAKAPPRAKVARHALKLTLRATGTHGTLSGRPFGRGRATIEIDPPQYYLMTWRFPRGSIVLLVSLPAGTSGAVSGSQCRFVIGGGTGRYARVRGSGTMTGTTDGRTWHVTAVSTTLAF